MQPYFFPYIGYFQLVNSANRFVFYDDVQYIKGGWINRNRVLVNGSAAFLTVELSVASQNKRICDVRWLDNSGKLLRTLRMAYGRAPFFRETIELVESCFLRAGPAISDLARTTVEAVAEHLGLDTRFESSGQRYAETRGVNRAQRLVDITRGTGATTYINANGGRILYDKEFFSAQGVNLRFLQEHIETYPQFRNEFVPGLSIIDVLMFNPRDRVRNMLDRYTLD